MKFAKELVMLIKQKKELSPLDDEYILTFLQSHDVDDDKYDSFEKFKRSKQCKDVVSLVRKQVRDTYGLFLNTPLSTKALQKGDLSKQLQLHKSTQERYDYYKQVYDHLFELMTQKGLTKEYLLFDIACGYNPLAYAFLPLSPKQYVGCDLSTQDMTLLQDFFDTNKYVGSFFACDVLSTRFLDYVQQHKFDVCFLFKALDPFEQVRRHSSKKILTALNTNFIVVSFSLFSIGGKKPIPTSKRSWFEKFCEKNNWSYQTFQIPNELFYVVKK